MLYILFHVSAVHITKMTKIGAQSGFFPGFWPNFSFLTLELTTCAQTAKKNRRTQKSLLKMEPSRALTRHAEKWTKMAQKIGQKGVKNGPKMCNKLIKNGSKIAQKWVKMGQNAKCLFSACLVRVQCVPRKKISSRYQPTTGNFRCYNRRKIFRRRKRTWLCYRNSRSKKCTLKWSRSKKCSFSDLRKFYEVKFMPWKIG